MTRVALLIQMIFIQVICFAQMPALPDSAYYMDWPEVGPSVISPDGNFILYALKNVERGKSITVIKAVESSWQRELPFIWNIEFSANNKKVYCIQDGKLLELSLGTNSEEQLAFANAFEYVSSAKGEFLIYKSSVADSFFIRNLTAGRTRSLSNVKDYKILPSIAGVFLKLRGLNDAQEVLKLLDMPSDKLIEVYHGAVTNKVIFDNSFRNLAFTTDEGTKIWHYNSSMKRARVCLDNDRIPAERKISSDDTWEFSEDGDKLYLSLPPSETEIYKKEGEPEVWSYQDKTVFPQYQQRGFRNVMESRYLASIDVKSGKLTALLFGDEHKPFGQLGGKDQFVIETGDSLKSYYVLDKKYNQRIPLKISTKGTLSDIQFSPDEKFITYNENYEGYRCFEIATQKTYNFTAPIETELELYDPRSRSGIRFSKGINCWIKGTTHVLMTGKYGIWELDVRGKALPKNWCRMNGFAENETFFSFCKNLKNVVIDPVNDLYLYGIDFKTKATSLCKLNLQKKQFTILYTAGFYWASQYNDVDENLFTKAASASAYLVKFPTVEHSPNLLYTKDFERFDTLTNVKPEKKYNWIKSELHTYKDSLGNSCQGILYKPDNFDSTKKYPVIFYFYQEAADVLHEHISPLPPASGISIPHLVSNGYLVFRPDIYIKPGKFGDYLLLSIHAAADHLQTFSWVNKQKMAIAGHSYGGYEVNFILTRTDRFAAALSGAGFSSLANNIFDFGVSNEEIRSFAISNSRMEIDFEDNPQLYIDNSPIFRTKNVRTPVLIVHSKDDRLVPFYHGSQFFLSLRHLHKPSWLLSYKNGGHGVPMKDRIDFMNRVKGFFDCYLKDASMPEWLEKHISF